MSINLSEQRVLVGNEIDLAATPVDEEPHCLDIGQISRIAQAIFELGPRTIEVSSKTAPDGRRQVAVEPVSFYIQEAEGRLVDPDQDTIAHLKGCRLCIDGVYNVLRATTASAARA